VREGMNIKITKVIKQDTCLHDQVRYSVVGSTRYGAGGCIFAYAWMHTRVDGQVGQECARICLSFGIMDVCIHLMFIYLYIK